MLKKTVALIILFSMLFVFCGCAGNENLKTKIIIEALGIDFEEDAFTVTVLAYKPQNPNGQSEEKNEVISYKSGSLSQAISSLSALSGKEPFYANNRIVIIGNKALNGHLKEIMDFIIRDTDMREDSYLIFANEARQVLNSKNLKEADNNYIFTLLQKNTEEGNCAVMTALEASLCFEKNLGDVFMPVAEFEKEELKLSKTLVFKDEKPLYTLDSRQSRYLLLLRDKLSRPVVSVRTDKGNAGVKFLNASLSLKKDKSDKTVINVKADIKCKINEKSDQSISNEDVKKGVEEEIKQNILNVIDIAQNNGTDIFNVTKYIRKYNFALYKEAKASKNNLLDLVEFKIFVDAQIMRSGRKNENNG